MNYKKILIVVIALVLIGSMAFAATRKPVRHVVATGQIKEGDFIISPEMVVAFHSVSIGGHAEYMFMKDLGIGGDLLFSFDGSGAMALCPDVNYHFDTKVPNLDIFIGGGPSLLIGFAGGTAFFFKLDGGTRYWFTPEIAAYFKFGGMIGADGSIFAAFGCSFRLK